MLDLQIKHKVMISFFRNACMKSDCMDKTRNNSLRRIPLNVRAICAKNIYQKTTHSTVTF